MRCFIKLSSIPSRFTAVDLLICVNFALLKDCRCNNLGFTSSYRCKQFTKQLLVRIKIIKHEKFKSEQPKHFSEFVEQQTSLQIKNSNKNKNKNFVPLTSII